MPIFQDSAQMYAVLGQLWQQLLDHPEQGSKFKQTGLSIKFNLTAPDGVIWIDAQKVHCGPLAGRADVEMTLSADTAHAFWLKKISLPTALATKQIVARGAMNKVMKMLPLLKPLYEAYPEICRQHGLPL
ncbi:MAG: SCP2 sterol-binding domain-containing protein [Bacillota bacterium]